MPPSVDNQFPSKSMDAANVRFGLNAPSEPSSRDSRDQFRKILDISREKMREPENKTPSKKTENSSRPATHAATGRSKRSKLAAGRQNADENSDELKSDPQVDGKTDQTDPAIDADSTPVSDIEESEDKPEKPDEKGNVAELSNPLSTGSNAVPLAPVPQNSLTTQPAETANDPAQLAMQEACITSSTAGATQAGVSGADTKGPTANAGESVTQNPFPLSDEQSAADQAAVEKSADGKLKKNAGFGQSTPRISKEDGVEKPADGSAKQHTAIDALSAADALAQLSEPGYSDDSGDESLPHSKPLIDLLSNDASAAQSLETAGAKSPAIGNSPAASPPPLPPEVGFADVNHDKIVTSLKSELLPNGGTMHIRLDPPELGVLQITVKMRDGVMTASFETSSSDATKLLSHSLSQLKATLESQGVSVEKLHVQESPRNDQNSAGDDRQQQPQQGEQSARQEQQRREMLKRMWRRLGIGNDPLDMVA